MDRRRFSGSLQWTHRVPGGMAGAGGGIVAAGGRGNRPGIKRLRAQRDLASRLAARRAMPEATRGAPPSHIAGFLKLLVFAALVAAAIPALAAEKILSARVWPAEEYTRVTFEAGRAMKHQMFFLQNPDRLVVDLDGIDLGEELKA